MKTQITYRFTPLILYSLVEPTQTYLPDIMKTLLNPLAHLSYISEIEPLWWDQYYVQNFSSLVPTQKWLDERRKMQVGNIVIIQYVKLPKLVNVELVI